MSGGGRIFLLNHSNIEAVLNNRHPGNSPRKAKHKHHCGTVYSINQLYTCERHLNYQTKRLVTSLCLLEVQYGKEVILETDHKPLISIARRNLSDCSSRIQRLLLKLQPYTFELIFTPGKHLVWADLLSRASNPNRESSTEADVKVHVDMIVNSLPVSEQKWEEISRETKTDYKLSQVLKHVLDGWSGPCAHVCQLYYSFSE